MKNRRAIAGFTLVELLVVIGIIALLIAILLPSLSRARAQASSLKCLSNLRQIGMGYLMYTQNNKGWNIDYFPSSGGGIETFWAGRIAKYMGRNSQQASVKTSALSNVMPVLLCPRASDPVESASHYWGTVNNAWNGKAHSPDSGWSWLHTAGPPEQWWVGSYGLNGFLYSNYNSNTAHGPLTQFYIKMTQVRQASSTPMFSDSTWDDGWPNPINGNNPDTTPANLTGVNNPDSGIPGNSTQRVCVNRHRGSINMVFVDGSARPLALNDLWKVAWFRNMPPTNFNPPLPKP